jgi:hypothetical protein
MTTASERSNFGKPSLWILALRDFSGNFGIKLKQTSPGSTMLAVILD